jgi:uncharacterized protein (TIGR04255 family)
MRTTEDPFTSAVPTEVPLKNAPLARVLVQVRFPEVLAIEQRGFVAPFQEAIRSVYPVLREEQVQEIVAAPGGAVQARTNLAWRFSDAEGHWRASLTAGFLALETTKYSSRADLIGRLGILLEALGKHIEPRQIDRFGVRYIDRVVGPAVAEIGSLVRHEVCGIAGSPAAQYAVHGLTETLFALGEDRILARWAHLPPGSTLDPAAIEPVAEQSWILDLDMFSTTTSPYAVPELVARARSYTERLYAFFRWAVTDEFLRRYGGTV